MKNHNICVFFTCAIGLFIGSLTALIISGIVIYDYRVASNFTPATCSNLVQTYVGSTGGSGYYCYGYSKLYDANNTYVGMTKLVYPIINKYLITVTKTECYNWVNYLTKNTKFTCYVNNDAYSINSIGYTILDSVVGYIVMISISSVILAFYAVVVGVIVYSSLKSIVKNKHDPQPVNVAPISTV